MKPPMRVLQAWSSGKDSSWSLAALRRRAEVEVVGLLTTFAEPTDRVAMHAVRRELVEQQATAAGLPLWSVLLPSPCTNSEYEQRMRALVDQARIKGVSGIAFGDLFLEEIQQYRQRMMANTALTTLFPIWTTRADTADLARRMINAGTRAILSSIDTRQLDERFLGREFDSSFLADLPDEVDPCGENGEFHTFCYAGPAFSRSIRVERGERVEYDGFVYLDLRPVIA